MRRIILTTTDGLRLDGRLDGPDPAPVTVVWCHPHPLFGGTMFAPLMNDVTDGLTAHGIGVLRFSFRGVGESEGRHEGGPGEVDDVAAAMECARALGSGVALAGWSFGAATAARYLAAAEADRDVPYVGVAPPADQLPEPGHIGGDRATLVIGSRDQVVDPAAVVEYARAAGAQLVEVEGADHFFMLRSAPIVDAIRRAVESVSAPPA
jgi:uncharacterized protein